MAEAEHRVLGERLKCDADKREEIGDGDGAAFFFGRRDVLDERVDRDDEESAEDADEGEKRGHGRETEAGNREDGGEDDETNETGEDHALLDFSGGGVSGGEAADSDAEAEGREQVAAVLVVYAKDVGGVEDDVEEEQRAEEPEESVGEDRHAEGGVAPEALRFFDEFARKIPVEAAGGIGSGKARH